MDNNIVQVHDRYFEPFIPEETIQREVTRLALEMNRDLAAKDPIFLGILNGAFMFASDLYKQLNFPCQITFLKLASYSGTKSTGSVKQLIGINRDLKGRVVVVLEDIVDTGHTMQHVLTLLQSRNPNSLEVCALLDKPSRREVEVELKWIGFEIPDEFVVGYGIDYAQRNRNLPYIGNVKMDDQA